jgi:PAS domain S-box-containing protein
VFERAAVGMGRVGFHDARWLEVNDTFCAMLGYGRDEMLATPWPEITHPDDVDLDLVPFRRMAAGALETYAVEKRFVHKAGHHVWARLTLSLVRDAAGHPDYEIAVIEDITERKRSEAERERLFAAAEAARAEAEAASRAKSDFLAVMSHELRTPLNAIGGYAQLMELGLHGPVTPEQVAALGRIQRGQQHLLGLINTVLNYAKLEAGRVEYHAADVPAAEVLAEVAALVAPQARVKGLALTVAPCAPGPGQAGASGATHGAAAGVAALVARADPEKVRQVLLNLLSNAVKFTRGGGTVTVACGRAPDGRVTFTVADTGRGIPADQLARVFEPFVQVDQRLTRTEDGTGLGLAISRDLARGMGGDLTVESTPGVGSTFTLALPAV